MPVPYYLKKKLAGAVIDGGGTTPPPTALTINVIEEAPASCQYPSGGTCIATSTCTAIVSGGSGTKTYAWVVTNAVIRTGQGTSSITVESFGNANTTSNVQCTVTDTTGSATKAIDITHIRNQLLNGTITKNTSGSCQYPNSGTCTATSTYTIATTGGSGTKIYTWSTSAGAITAGQGTANATVQTTSNLQDDFTVRCDVTDASGNIIRTLADSHTRNQTLTGYIVKNTAGTCMYPQSGTCAATSTYTANPVGGSGTKTYAWSTTAGTITAGQGTANVSIQTTSAVDNNFTVSVVITDANGSVTPTLADTHTRTEALAANITKSTSGSCTYPAAGTCSANSTYNVFVSGGTGTKTYTWATTAGAITAGQGTTSATVTTTSGATDNFTVSCVVADANGSLTPTLADSHVRSQVVSAASINSALYSTTLAATSIPAGNNRVMIAFFGSASTNPSGDPVKAPPASFTVGGQVEDFIIPFTTVGNTKVRVHLWKEAKIAAMTGTLSLPAPTTGATSKGGYEWQFFFLKDVPQNITSFAAATLAAAETVTNTIVFTRAVSTSSSGTIPITWAPNPPNASYIIGNWDIDALGAGSVTINNYWTITIAAATAGATVGTQIPLNTSWTSRTSTHSNGFKLIFSTTELDLDADGLPDTQLLDEPSRISIDDDSINIDFNRDGIIDLEIPLPKPKRSKK
jgi:hypothetical protein